jgi:hypothetical protein
VSEPVVRISIDMDRRCVVCRRKGAQASGRCLRCGAAEASEHLKRGFTTHAASRKEQAAEREMLRNRIAAIASTIRSAGR